MYTANIHIMVSWVLIPCAAILHWQLLTKSLACSRPITWSGLQGIRATKMEAVYFFE